MVLNIVEFIYNNFLSLSVIVGSFAFFILFFKQWYEEHEMNRRLSEKKTMLRNLRDAARKRPSLTRALMVGLPIVFLAGFLYWVFSPPMDYNYHIKRLEDVESFADVRTSFNEKFYSNPLQSSTDVDDLEALRRITNKKANTFEGINYALEHDELLYVTTSYGIEILRKDDGALEKMRTLLFPSSECESFSFNPEGLFMQRGKLVVLAQKSEGSCDGPVHGLLDLKRRTVVRVYDVEDDFVLDDTYEFSGLLSNAMFDGQTLYMSVNHYITNEDPRQDPEDVLPVMSVNGASSKPDFSDVRYIENTNPNNFMTMYAIDILETEVNYETTLTDYGHHLNFYGESAYMATNSYTFESTSTMFQLPDPIESVDTIVTKFSLVSGNVHYSRTKKLEGSISDKEHLTIRENKVFLVTEDKERTQQHIYRLDQQLNEIAALEVEDHASVSKVFNHGDHLYLFSGEGDDRTRIYDVRTEAEIEYLDFYTGLGQLDHYEMNNLFDMLLGFEKQEDRLVMTMYEAVSNEILTPKRRTTIDYGDMGLQMVEDYPFDNIAYERNRSLLFVPLFNGVTDPQQANEGSLLRGYELYPNMWFGPESHLSFTHTDFIEAPYTYRYVSGDTHVYHITPSGVVLSERDTPFEVIQRLTFLD